MWKGHVPLLAATVAWPLGETAVDAAHCACEASPQEARPANGPRAPRPGRNCGRARPHRRQSARDSRRRIWPRATYQEFQAPGRRRSLNETQATVGWARPRRRAAEPLLALRSLDPPWVIPAAPLRVPTWLRQLVGNALGGKWHVHRQRVARGRSATGPESRTRCKLVIQGERQGGRGQAGGPARCVEKLRCPSLLSVLALFESVRNPALKWAERPSAHVPRGDFVVGPGLKLASTWCPY